MGIKLMAADGSLVPEEMLDEVNKLLEVIDGAEIQGSINEMIDHVDLDKLAALEVPSDLEEAINFYRNNAAAVTVYAEMPRALVGGRPARGNVYVRGLDEQGELLKDGKNYISLWLENLDLAIEKEGTQIHPEVKKQIVALTLASRIAEEIGKPYRKFSELPELRTMSPERLLDFSILHQEGYQQIKEALHVGEKA